MLHSPPTNYQTEGSGARLRRPWHVSEGGAVMSRCGFRSVRYLEVKIRCKNALGPRIVSAVRSSFGGGRFSEVANVLQYKYGIFNP